MSAYSLIPRGRVAAERDMLDTCTVKHLTGLVTDQETGVVTPTYTTVYEGKCKVRQSSPATAPTELGEAAVFVGQLTLHLPVNAASALVSPDDLAELDTCVLDPSLIGRPFRLRGPAHKSFATARRFPMVEVSG